MGTGQHASHSLSESCLKRERRMWFWPLQSHSPHKNTQIHSGLHMPHRKPWSSLRPILVSPSLIWCKSPASFVCIHCSLSQEQLGSQPRSPLPTQCATAHAPAYFVARHPSRRVAGKDRSGILGELQLQLFCFTEKKKKSYSKLCLKMNTFMQQHLPPTIKFHALESRD